MERNRTLRFGIVVALGLLVSLWWTWAVSLLINELFQLLGSSGRPSRTFFMTINVVSSVIVGLIGGGVVAALVPWAALRAWVVFAACAVVAIVAALLVMEASENLVTLALDPGTWAFAVGTIVIPGVVHFVRKRTRS